MNTFSILGSGGWGTAMAIMLANEGNDVTVWSKFPEEIKTLSETRENTRLLKGVKIPDSVKLTSSMSEAMTGEFVIFAVPSHVIRSTAKEAAPYVKEEQILISIAKGIEEGTGKRLSEIIEDETGSKKVCALTGPSHAEEVGRGVPTTILAASRDMAVAQKVQDAVMNSRFRIYTSDDVIGAELGAALKNVIALCAGICDGQGFGDNTKAALMTRGITEMARLGVKMGASKETFAGLSGIGDLIVTCTSMHSRNRRAGILIGQGMKVEDALKEVDMVVEGYKAAYAAYELSKKYGVNMPITEQAYKVLYEGKAPADAIHELMTRSKKHENEEIWLED